ncbi:MAG: DUF1730 domain-containing protein, partial [Leptospiraceae bacterium]|nr:DUF1730 domain-containing protein [Leptospiraceae bacterium]
MTNKSLISKKFLELGFNLVGFSKASIPKSDKDNINSWIQNKYYGQMNWFPKNNELRTEFKNLGFTPNSIIALGLVYNTKEYSKVTANFNFKFSRYAVGKDYHDVLREKAKPGLKYLKENFPNNHFRQGVDSLPVPEKILAREAGIGWIGKNTNLIHPELGSFFFL